MELIRCHINGFGKFSNVNFDFKDNPFAIVEDNGYGKTTLTNFIRCMLFRNSKLIKNYEPLHATEFGGMLELMHEEKLYRIERNFAANGVKAFSLYIDGTRQKVDEKMIPSMLGIDEQVFEKLVLIDHEEIKIKESDSILKQLMGSVADEAKISKINDTITNLKRELSSGRGSETTKAIGEQILEAETKLNKIKKAETELDELFARLEETKADIENIEASLNQVKSYSGYIEAKKRYDEAKANLDNLLTDFKNGCPDEYETEQIKSLNEELKSINTRIENLNKDLSPLDLEYSSDTIAKIETDLAEFRNYSFALEHSSASSYSFEEYEKIIASYNEIKRLQQHIFAPAKQSTVLISVGIALSIISIITLILGIVLPQNIVMIASIVVLVLSIFSILYGNAIKNSNKGVNSLISEEKEKLFSLIGPHNDDLQEYIGGLKNEYENNSSQIKQREEAIIKLDELTKSLSLILNMEVNRDNYVSLASDVLIQANEAMRHKQNYEDALTKINDLENKKEDVISQVNEMLAKFNLVGNFSDLDELLNILNMINIASKKLDEEEKQLNKYRLADGSFPSVSDTNTSELEIRLKDLREESDNINKAIGEKKGIVRGKNETIELLKELRAKLEDTEKKVMIITNIEKYVKLAQDSLKGKYLDPIVDRFDKYVNLLEACLGKKVTINSNFNISYEYNGKTVLQGQMSSGELSLVMLCLRLALADEVLNGVHFVILDDPFMTLDEKHLVLAKKLLNDLSTTTQIIYLTCHASRAL